jgi:ankyrin repeat protein
LIAVIKDEDEDEDSRVVQFSHFSVKEFLTSDRLATSKVDASRYHHILLDADKPHFVAWVRMCRLGHLPRSQPDLSPLYYLAGRGYCSLVGYLISKRPDDVNVRGAYGTPLHASLEEGHANVAQLLLRHCVDVDIRGNQDQTPLHLAADHGFLGVTRTLVERNADINARDSSGNTPLHRTLEDWFRAPESAHDGCLAVVKFLLEHGADADAKNDKHLTPLHQASFHGFAKGAQSMLEDGANIHARDKESRTPLHRVLDRLNDGNDLLNMYLDTIRCLLSHGADIDALDDDHATPLHLASRYGCAKGAQLLLEHGANVRLENKTGRTPFQVAEENDKTNIILLLSEHLQS